MKKFTAMFLSILFSATLFLSPVSYAATGNQGYAVYRDGVVGNIDWHTGIMVESYTSASQPISHARGKDYQTELTSYNSFVGPNLFKGTYRPRTGIPSDNTRNLIVATARYIASEHIEYSAILQMDYNDSTTGAKVMFNDITNIRCDGVVEYCYEYNFQRVFGVDDVWDISKNASAEKNLHTFFKITPLSQASQYMFKMD